MDDIFFSQYYNPKFPCKLSMKLETWLEEKQLTFLRLSFENFGIRDLSDLDFLFNDAKSLSRFEMFCLQLDFVKLKKSYEKYRSECSIESTCNSAIAQLDTHQSTQLGTHQSNENKCYNYILTETSKNMRERSLYVINIQKDRQLNLFTPAMEPW